MIFFFGSRRTSIFGGTGGVMRPAPRDRGASGWEHPVSLIGHCPIFGHLAQRRAGYLVVVMVVIVVVTVIWSLRDSLYIPLPSIASESFWMPSPS